jgi:hypothetical protein
LALDVVILDDEQALGVRDGKGLDALERRFQSIGGGRLYNVGESSVRKTMLALFFQSDDLDRNVARARSNLS